MVNEKSSKWIIAIVIYFILVGSLFSLVSLFKAEYGLTDTGIVNSSGGGYSTVLSVGDCSSPRFTAYYTGIPETISWDTQPPSYYKTDELNTKYSTLTAYGYINNIEECESLNGATWDTRSWLSFSYGDETCLGNINLTYYNDDVYFDDINSYNDFLQNDSHSICDLSKLQNDESLCNAFGCSYVTNSNIEDLTNTLTASGSLKTVGVVLTTVKDVATLRLSFGFDNDILNGLLTFLLIWIPILGLVFSFYELVRG